MGLNAPSGNRMGASSPLADVVSFASRSVPLERIAFLLASALAAAVDIVVVVALNRNTCFH